MALKPEKKKKLDREYRITIYYNSLNIITLLEAVEYFYLKKAVSSKAIVLELYIYFIRAYLFQLSDINKSKNYYDALTYIYYLQDFSI